MTTTGAFGHTPLRRQLVFVMVDSVVEVERKQGFLIALKRWMIPVFFADADTPRYRVRLEGELGQPPAHRRRWYFPQGTVGARVGVRAAGWHDLA